MGLAARVGLDVAAAEPRAADTHPYLIVTRYDRAQDVNRTVRLHQEDACQALGVAAERKCAAEGGPAFRDLFELMRAYFCVAAVLNFAIGDVDAHGKNLSHLLDARETRLAPLCDLLATIDSPQLTPQVATRVGITLRSYAVADRRWRARSFPSARQATCWASVPACGRRVSCSRWSSYRSSSQILGKNIMTIRGFIERLMG